MKKLLKKVVVTLLALSVLLSVTACGETGEGKTKIKFFGWGSESEIRIFGELIEMFEEKYPQYEVEQTSCDADTYLQVLVSSSKRTFPDVFYIPDVNFVQMINGKDIMLDLAEYVNNSTVINKSDMYEEGINAYRFDRATKTLGEGSIYALPKDLGPNVVCYNKTHVLSRGIKVVSDENGENYKYGYGYYNGEKVLNDRIPMTWAQLLQFCIDCQTGTDTSSIAGMTHYPWEAAYIASGGRFLSDDYKQVTINNDKFAEAVQIAGDFFDYGAMPSTTQQATQNYIQRFTSGLAAVSWIGAWNTPELWNVNFEWDILPCPVPNVSGIDEYDAETCASVRTELMTEEAREGSKSTYKLGSVGLAVYKESSCPEGAYLLTEFLTYNTDAQRHIWKSGQAVPNVKSMAEGEFMTEKINDPKGMNRPANRKVYLDMLENSNRRPEAYTYDTEWYTEISGTANDSLKLKRIWARKKVNGKDVRGGKEIALWDWSKKSPEHPSGEQTYSENMLKNLCDRVQEVYLANFKGSDLKFKWNTTCKI